MPVPCHCWFCLWATIPSFPIPTYPYPGLLCSPKSISNYSPVLPVPPRSRAYLKESADTNGASTTNSQTYFSISWDLTSMLSKWNAEKEDLCLQVGSFYVFFIVVIVLVWFFEGRKWMDNNQHYWEVRKHVQKPKLSLQPNDALFLTLVFKLQIVNNWPAGCFWPRAFLSLGLSGQAKPGKYSWSSTYSSCEFHLKQRSGVCINQLNLGGAEYVVGDFFMTNNPFKLILHRNRIGSGLHKLYAPGCTSYSNFAHFRSATYLTTR